MTKIYEALENAGNERMFLNEQYDKKFFINAHNKYNNAIERT